MTIYLAMLLYDIKLVCYHNNIPHYLFSLFFFEHIVTSLGYLSVEL